MRVLIVDDNEALLETAALLIELYGHEVRTCNRSSRAVDTALEFVPEMAFLDIGMPDLDGYELCRRLRGVPSLAGMKIVAQSGYGDTQSKQLATDAGFDIHLLKPVAAEDLERVLTECQQELSENAPSQG